MKPAFYPYCESGHPVTAAQNGTPCRLCVQEAMPSVAPAPIPKREPARQTPEPKARGGEYHPVE